MMPMLSYYHVSGATASVPFVEIMASADIRTTGSLIFNNDSPRSGVTVFNLGITATPTASYNIALPPTAPTGNDQVLQIADNSADPKTTRVGHNLFRRYPRRWHVNHQNQWRSKRKSIAVTV